MAEADSGGALCVRACVLSRYYGLAAGPRNADSISVEFAHLIPSSPPPSLPHSLIPSLAPSLLSRFPPLKKKINPAGRETQFQENFFLRGGEVE